ncbi:MAG TPA: CoA transferase [Candidatus Methylomirabilis sp.]|nr:CoA transferase [Candidatus Methylomirabilis sp.]HSC70113.1 CoA transferase [Candidatus Methylomirabilis sp.]
MADQRTSFEEYCRDVFDPKKIFEKPEVFKGYVAISATQYILGPSCANYFAEMGMETIKVELPRRGEPMRHTTPYNEPFLYPLSKQMPDKGTGLGFFGANHNEYFLSVDFHKPEGVEIMHRLHAKADVQCENYRPGTFDRWGIGYRQAAKINPRLIYVWMGGFGGWGPGRVRASYDILGQAQGGCFSVTGFPGPGHGHPTIGLPSKHTIWLADYWGGMMGCFAALAALWWRDNVSGVGELIEYSQVHGATRHLESALPLYGRYGVVKQRWGDWDTEMCVHGIVQCGKSSYPDSKNPQEQEQGYILISAPEDNQFATLCQVVSTLKPLADKYATADARIQPAAQTEIYNALEAWAKDKTKEDVWRIMEDAGVNSQPVWSNKEVAQQEHFHMRDELHWLDDPYFGDVLSQGLPYHLSETPARHRWVFKPVGADNEYILQKYCGYGLSEIRELERNEII